VEPILVLLDRTGRALFSMDLHQALEKVQQVHLVEE
jgi:hypothetical protein